MHEHDSGYVRSTQPVAASSHHCSLSARRERPVAAFSLVGGAGLAAATAAALALAAAAVAQGLAAAAAPQGSAAAQTTYQTISGK